MPAVHSDRSGSFAGRTWPRALPALTATALLLPAAPAHAHHAMGGTTPQTLSQGLLSGLAHPVIGPDHLAIVVAIGIIAAMAGRKAALVALFIAASMAGVLIHVAGVAVAGNELLVAGSVLACGLLILASRGRPAWIWWNLAMAAGLVHGYAYGESIVGAEASPLGAYLAGLAAIQSVIAMSAYAATLRLDLAPEFRQAWLPRAGAVLALMGGALMVLALPTG